MKLVIQIPAYNEEFTLERAIDDVRKAIPIKPFDEVEIVVINDGSTDKTLDVARKINVKHIIGFSENQGLGVVFKRGLEYSLSIGADVIVNTDADLQYFAAEIEFLVNPILDRKADMVIGDRCLASVAKYPLFKFFSQISGNSLISILFRQKIKDSTSGFRALNKEAAAILIAAMANKYTYTIESICILLNSKKCVSFVPIHVREFVRPSRLIKNKIYYVFNYLCIVFSYFFRRFYI